MDSEEQRAVLEEGRQRSDKISRLMGAYLLKRYRMLSETCYVCKNILLQSPQGVKYCVNCEEIEKEPTGTSSSVSQQRQRHLAASNQSLTHCKVEINYEQVECVLLTKLQAAVMTLQEASSTENTIQQCHVITACSEAILAIKKLTAANTPT